MCRRTIILHGALRKYGQQLTVDADTIRQAIEAMCLLLGIKPHPIRGRYPIKIQGVNHSEDLDSNNPMPVLHVVPACFGGKSAIQMIAGAVLIVVGVALTYLSAGTLSTVGAAMATAGAAMLLSGLCAFLFPTTMASKGKNYYQGPPGNTTKSGTPKQLAFGTKVYIAGHFLSYNVQSVSR